MASVVAGAKILSSADDTVAAWQLVRDVPSGAVVEESDVRGTHVHFDEPGVAAHYLTGAAPILPGARATRDLQAGEMLAADALSSEPSPLRRQLPLAVAAAQTPADLRPGDHVQVWAVANVDDVGARADRAAPVEVLPDVMVLTVGSGLSGVSGDRQILVGLSDDVDLADVLGKVAGAQVVLVRLAS